MRKQQAWKVISSSIAFPHPFLTVVEEMVQLPNGEIIPDYSIWDHPDVAQIVPILPNGNFLLVSVYKHGIKETIVEFPGGFCEKFESPKQAALRELAEETGYYSPTATKLGVVCHHPTKESGRLHLFFTSNLSKSLGASHPEQSEQIEVVEYTPAALAKRLRNSKTVQTSTWLGYFLAMEHLKHAQ